MSKSFFVKSGACAAPIMKKLPSSIINSSFKAYTYCRQVGVVFLPAQKSMPAGYHLISRLLRFSKAELYADSKFLICFAVRISFVINPWIGANVTIAKLFDFNSDLLIAAGRFFIIVEPPSERAAGVPACSIG